MFFSIGKHCSLSRPFIPDEKRVDEKSLWNGNTHDNLKNVVLFFIKKESEKNRKKEYVINSCHGASKQSETLRNEQTLYVHEFGIHPLHYNQEKPSLQGM